MNCEACGAAVFEGDAACAECGRELPAVKPARGPPRVEAEAFTPEPAIGGLAPGVEEPPPADAARCAEHPDLLSAATCARCGRFCCIRCVSEPSARAVCPSCQRLTRTQENPGELRRVRLEVKASFFFATLVALLFGVALPVGFAAQNVSLVWLASGLATSLTLGILAVLFALTERWLLGWVAVSIETLGAAMIFLVVGGKCLSWPLIAFPILTGFRIFKWQALRAEAEQLTRAAG